MSASGQRPLLVRLVDPLDIAGTAARAVDPRRHTPQKAHLVFYAVLAGLGAAEVVEPPIAAVMALGHLLASSSNATLHEAGGALDEAA